MPIPIASSALFSVSTEKRAEIPNVGVKITFFIFVNAGSVEKGVVEVTNCFCVPHKETHDQVEAEISYASDIYDLNRKVNSSESIVGE